MKSPMPFHILLAIVIVVTGAMITYNLSLRQDFAVVVGYSLPQGGEDNTAGYIARQTQIWEPEDPEDNDEYLYDDYWEEPVIIATFPLELNTASMDELMYIPGIGNVTAQRIVQYRQELNGYMRLEQLMEIQGIGEKTFEAIAPYLYIEGQWSPEEEK